MTKADLEKVFQTARQLLNRSWAVEAEQLVRTAIAMHPGTPELQDLLGECLLNIRVDFVGVFDEIKLYEIMASMLLRSLYGLV